MQEPVKYSKNLSNMVQGTIVCMGSLGRLPQSIKERWREKQKDSIEEARWQDKGWGWTTCSHPLAAVCDCDGISRRG